MKKILLLIAISLISILNLSAQDMSDLVIPQNRNKGKFFAYWGWNWADFTKSNIHFKGEGFDFTLKKVVANDRQTPFNWGTYFNPVKGTIPQVNIRVGYFFKDNYSISVAHDHMKYVMDQDQVVKIDGKIEGTGTKYDGVYSNDDITLSEDFLKFEHTNGLNYANVEIRRYDHLFSIRKLKMDFELVEGFGVGILYPKSDVTLINNAQNNKFNLAGYGFAPVVGLNAKFLKHFFIMGELKGGFINMPNVKVTNLNSDKGKQSFFFFQRIIVAGASFRLWKDKKSTEQ